MRKPSPVEVASGGLSTDHSATVERGRANRGFGAYERRVSSWVVKDNERLSGELVSTDLSNHASVGALTSIPHGFLQAIARLCRLARLAAPEPRRRVSSSSIKTRSSDRQRVLASLTRRSGTVSPAISSRVMGQGRTFRSRRSAPTGTWFARSQTRRSAGRSAAGERCGGYPFIATGLRRTQANVRCSSCVIDRLK